MRYDIYRGVKRIKTKFDLTKSLMGLVALALPAVLFLSNGGVLAATQVVSPSNMQGWGFVQETPTGSGQMVNGPDSPPLGTGSANLIVDNTGGEILTKAAYQGLRLDHITTLQYSTYRTSGASALAIALQFNIDSDVTDANNAFQGRLVYEPYYTQTVNTGQWQSWNTLNDTAGTGTGNWWFSNGALATISSCSIATPCTWAEVLSAFPNAGVHNTLGAVILKAGGGWIGGFNGNTDALMVNSDTYNFELANVPHDKNQCKHHGWMSLTDENGEPFRNQGQCVSFVAHSRHGHPDGHHQIES